MNVHVQNWITYLPSSVLNPRSSSCGFRLLLVCQACWFGPLTCVLRKAQSSVKLPPHRDRSPWSSDHRKSVSSSVRRKFVLCSIFSNAYYCFLVYPRPLAPTCYAHTHIHWVNTTSCSWWSEIKPIEHKPQTILIFFINCHKQYSCLLLK